MPARNLDHDAVVAALEADGWTITADPYILVVGARRLLVDLAATGGSFGAERGGHRIAVEVQSFTGRGSAVEKLHMAVGQYAVYRAALTRLDPGRALYLGVPAAAFAGIFREEMGRLVVEHLGIKLVVFRAAEGRIERWID